MTQEGSLVNHISVNALLIGLLPKCFELYKKQLDLSVPLSPCGSGRWVCRAESAVWRTHSPWEQPLQWPTPHFLTGRWPKRKLWSSPCCSGRPTESQNGKPNDSWPGRRMLRSHTAGRGPGCPYGYLKKNKRNPYYSHLNHKTQLEWCMPCYKMFLSVQRLTWTLITSLYDTSKETAYHGWPPPNPDINFKLWCINSSSSEAEALLFAQVINTQGQIRTRGAHLQSSVVRTHCLRWCGTSQTA